MLEVTRLVVSDLCVVEREAQKTGTLTSLGLGAKQLDEVLKCVLYQKIEHEQQRSFESQYFVLLIRAKQVSCIASVEEPHISEKGSRSYSSIHPRMDGAVVFAPATGQGRGTRA